MHSLACDLLSYMRTDEPDIRVRLHCSIWDNEEHVQSITMGGGKHCHYLDA